MTRAFFAERLRQSIGDSGFCLAVLFLVHCGRPHSRNQHRTEEELPQRHGGTQRICRGNSVAKTVVVATYLLFFFAGSFLHFIVSELTSVPLRVLRGKPFSSFPSAKASLAPSTFRTRFGRKGQLVNQLILLDTRAPALRAVVVLQELARLANRQSFPDFLRSPPRHASESPAGHRPGEVPAPNQQRWH